LILGDFRTSKDKLNFLKDVNKHIEVDLRGKFKYTHIPYFETKQIREFILNLDCESFYTIIPILSIYDKEDDPYIILSKQILISSYSSPELIRDYLDLQLDKAIIDFDLNIENKFHYLILKHKIIKILI
jgi:hypothetical protein